MRTLNLFPCVYVLELEGDEKYDSCFYIGCTHNLNHRLSRRRNVSELACLDCQQTSGGV